MLFKMLKMFEMFAASCHVHSCPPITDADQTG